MEDEMCQRPKRALSISTGMNCGTKYIKELCQRPKRALSISTLERCMGINTIHMCQRPKRALSISTILKKLFMYRSGDVSTP